MIFVSYSHKDRNQVKTFLSNLDSLIDKKDIWIDYERIDLSFPIKPRIDAALRNMQYFILFVSSSSMRSNWVNYEYQLAKKILPKEHIFQVILEEGLEELK